MPKFEGITDDQKKYLNRSCSRKKSLRDQWFEVWEVLFPGRSPPQSPFIGNYIEEMTPLFRGFWNDRSSEIVSSVLRTHQGAQVDTSMLKNIICCVFDHLEAGACHGRSSIQPGKVSQMNQYIEPAQCLYTADVQQTIAPEFDAASGIGFQNPYEL